MQRLGRRPASPALSRPVGTITTVGILAAAAIWASLGDPHRFAHAKQVARYAGLDPSFVQSGEELRHGRISKNGNTLLRMLLVEVALGLGRRDEGPLGQFYRRKKAQLSHKKTGVALARKILVVAWRMLLTGEGYRTSKPRQIRASIAGSIISPDTHHLPSSFSMAPFPTPISPTPDYTIGE